MHLLSTSDNVQRLQFQEAATSLLYLLVRWDAVNLMEMA
jgi:hypothetical protein